MIVGGVLGDALPVGGAQNVRDVLSCRFEEADENFSLGVSRDRESLSRGLVLVMIAGVVYRAICDGVEGDRVAFNCEFSAERSRRLDGVVESMGS